ncbi:MAG: flagellar M-ring protein FliF [Lachnospiraceae bacterium]|nr:flagellar M-ring protein FliF [Lachnospiraceae bacterium]
MPERIRAILDRIREWWGKFTTRQKTLIISVAAAVVVAVTVFVWAISIPKYTTLIICESTGQTGTIRDLLDEAAIPYKISTDGLTVEVEQSRYSDAAILLGSNNIPTTGPELNDVFSGGFSTTESDKEKRYQLYLEEYISKNLEQQENISHATVNLTLPSNDGTILSSKEEAYASVMLTVNDKDAMTDDVAAGLARFIATAVGNDSTANVVIMDTTGGMLFSGESNAAGAGGTGSASTRLSYKAKYDQLIKGEIRDALVGAKIYDNVQVAPNLVLNWSDIEKTEHTYTPAENQDQGVLSHRDVYSQTATNGGGQVPGTDTNGENTYMYMDNANSTTTTDEQSEDFLPNETITKTTGGGGAIDYENSSIGITAIHYIIYNEDDLKAQGLLDGITFEEYKAANSERIKGTVDDDVISVVAMATGIPAGNISIVAYDEPIFIESQAGKVPWQTILMIALIVLILGLLAFVVIRSMRQERAEEETEEEYSLDNLLQSTQEAQMIEDIEVDAKSDARIMIEKFVDENPEAAANLLRNWLQDEWG